MAEDDDTGREDAEDQDEREDEDETDEGEEETPESIKAERDRLRRAYAKVKTERSQLRRQVASKKEPEKDTAKEAEERANARLVRTAAIGELQSAGLTKAQAKVAVRFLDLADVEVDEDGDVVDLDERVEELKELFPKLFEKEPERDRRPVRTGAGSGRRERPTGSTGDKVTDALLKQAGYR